MINIGNGSIENILVGDVLVGKVYLGINVVWERQQSEEHDYIEIGGVRWATVNVGANNVTDTGLYFLWGDTQGYTASQVGTDKLFSWSYYKYTNDDGSTMTKYNSTDNKIVLDLSDDPANFNWGSDWRLPTTAEFQALSLAVDTEWTDDYQGSGVAGLVCTDKTDSSKILFFPACGFCNTNSVRYAGSYSDYWSNSIGSMSTQYARFLFSNNSRVGWLDNGYRYYGFPVRAVHVRDYLKFTALESGTFTLTIPAEVTATSLASVSYSLDNGATWITTLNDSSEIIIVTPTINAGRNVLWKGSGSQTAIGQNSGQYSVFSSTGNFKCSGNIMSLLYGDDFEDKTTLTMAYCFCELFRGCSTIITTPQLPATTITQNCYREMFRACTQLLKASKLPATSLQDRCYLGMFYACSALTDIPEDMLPATTTKQYCYYLMFYSCSSITHTPTLPTLTLTNNCYQQMFTGCSNLIYITCFATSISATNCTTNWVNGVGSNGTFVKNASMQSWVTGRDGIPSGWTTIDYSS